MLIKDCEHLLLRYPCVISMRLATMSMMLSFLFHRNHLNGLLQCGATEMMRALASQDCSLFSFTNTRNAFP